MEFRTPLLLISRFSTVKHKNREFLSDWQSSDENAGLSLFSRKRMKIQPFFAVNRIVSKKINIISMQPVLIKPFFPIRQFGRFCGSANKVEGRASAVRGRTKNERFYCNYPGPCSGTLRISSDFKQRSSPAASKNLRHIGRRTFLHRHAASWHFGSGACCLPQTHH